MDGFRDVLKAYTGAEAVLFSLLITVQKPDGSARRRSAGRESTLWLKTALAFKSLIRTGGR